jgi:RNA polymerase sigma-70 factor (ECF subfamily)
LPNRNKYSEEDLVTLLKSKSESAFHFLYDHYSGALYNIIVKIVRDEEAAQDILQDAFVKIWKNIDQYEKIKGTLFTWMLNIVRNTAIDFTRSKHVKNNIQNADSNVSIEIESTEAVNLDHIGVKETITSLKPELREVIEILYFKGYTQEEAAEELKLPLGTLKTRARTAIFKLRELLKDTVT